MPADYAGQWSAPSRIDMRRMEIQGILHAGRKLAAAHLFHHATQAFHGFFRHGRYLPIPDETELTRLQDNATGRVRKAF